MPSNLPRIETRHTYKEPLIRKDYVTRDSKRKPTKSKKIRAATTRNLAGRCDDLDDSDLCSTPSRFTSTQVDIADNIPFVSSSVTSFE